MPRRPVPPVRLLLLVSSLALGIPVASHAAPEGGGDLAAAAKAPDPLDQISHIPESNPYRAALAGLLSMPEADRLAIRAWTNYNAEDSQGKRPTLTPDQTALARQIAQTVAAASTASPTTAADWPMQIDPKDPENPIGAISPEIGTLRQLARITTRVADTYAPADAIPLYAATARLGREARQGETLIKQLMGVAIEGVALADASRRLNEFSPAQLEALSAAWSGLPPPSTIERAMDTERDRFFTPICEKILLPGIKAYLAAEKNSALNDDSPAPSLSHLRLSALVDFGDGEKRITLENLSSGDFFTVSPGRPAEGIELLEFDIPGQRAYIRVDGRDAMINLQTKEIVARSAVLKKFRQFLDDMEFAEANDNEDGKLTRQAWLDRIKNHPGGPDAYFAKIAERYGEIIQKQIAAASQATPSKNPPPLEKLDPFADPLLESIAPTFLKVARTLNTSDTGALMLQAAIRHRLGQADRAPTDPWAPATEDTAAAPFTYTATPDGGFTLTSRYERDSGEPTTYKFAARDAGVIRKR